jgi:hypothetical protein
MDISTATAAECLSIAQSLTVNGRDTRMDTFTLIAMTCEIFFALFLSHEK